MKTRNNEMTTTTTDNVTVTLPREAIALLTEAIDSHIYWQLSDSQYRDSGNVRDPGSDDDDTVRAIEDYRGLAVRLEAQARSTAAGTAADVVSRALSVIETTEGADEHAELLGELRALVTELEGAK
jgi:hypothetical protein